MSAILEVSVQLVGTSIFVNIFPSLVDFTAQYSVIWPNQLLNLKSIISFIVSDNLGVSVDILGCKCQLNIILHCLCKLRVTFIDEYDFLGVHILQSVYLVVCNGNTEQFPHLLLARDVTTSYHIFLEVYGNAATRDKVFGGYLVVRVVW